MKGLHVNRLTEKASIQARENRKITKMTDEIIKLSVIQLDKLDSQSN